MATFAAFLTAVQGLSVTGIAAASQYDQPPNSLNTADLPVSFPLLPSGGIGEKLVSCWDQNETRTIRFVIVTEPAGQSTQATKYAALAALMDNAGTAFKGLERSQGGTLAVFIEYDIEAAIITIAGIDYWGIMSEIRARDI
jgi:hypothetical protein